MRYVLTVVFCFVLLLGVCPAAEKPAIEPQKDKESYSIGFQVGTGMKTDGVDVNVEKLIEGLRDAVEGKEAKLGTEEMKKLITDLRKRVREAQKKKVDDKVAKNLSEGRAFLAENKKKEGVKTTESGLQYKVIKEGDGRTPKATDTVTVHYKGAFIDGKEFDNTYERGAPEQLQLEGIIPGWAEALQLMKAGSKWQLILPSDLAYGREGQGSRIPPNSVLIFDVDLLSIGPKKDESGTSGTSQTPDKEEKK